MKMTLNLKVVNDLVYQKYRLLFLATQFKEGFYQDRGFLLDIDNSIEQKSISVHLEPKVADFYKNNIDWEKVNYDKLEDIWGTDPDKLLGKDTATLFKNNIIQNEDIIKKWSRYQDRVLDLMKHFDCTQRKYTISIIFTNLGTLSSFHPVKYYDQLFIYIREDAGFEALVYGIVNLLIQSNVRYGDYEQRQKVCRFIYDMPLFREMLGETYLSNERIAKLKVSSRDIKKSRENYMYIGFPVNDSLLIMNGRIYIDRDKPFSDLTISENKLLFHFINHKHELVTYDDLSELLWSDDFYSLQAITKQMQRLREKLDEVFNRKLIKTVRGKGYIYEG